MDWRRRWWMSELDALVDAGVLEPGVSSRVREHYADRAAARPAIPLFAVLGAALIGLGAVLLLAHNWASLSDPMRTAVSLGTVAVGQGVAGFALWRRIASTAWTEAAALFASLGFAAGLALLQQTHQIPGDLGGFLVTWGWCTIPLAYALDSRAAFALVLGIAVSVIPFHWGDDASPWPFWSLIAAVVPYAGMLGRRSAMSARDGLVAWVGVPAVLAGCLLQAPLGHVFFVALLTLATAAAFVAMGDRELHSLVPFAKRAANALGMTTLAGALFVLGFSDAWGGLDQSIGASGAWHHALPAWGVGALAVVGIGWGAVAAGSRRDVAQLLWLGVPLAFVVAFFAGGFIGDETGAAWTMALYAGALGAATVLSGLAHGALGRANGGMLLLGAVIAQRFLDSEWSFTVRGLVFMGLGLAFLVLNLHLRRRGEDNDPPGSAQEGGAQ
ncbi:MAG: DUF2157 domain-containing protein [Myxococcota bacterium]